MPVNAVSLLRAARARTNKQQALSLQNHASARTTHRHVHAHVQIINVSDCEQQLYTNNIRIFCKVKSKPRPTTEEAK